MKKMRLIDADQMLRDESEAYMRAQVKVSGVTYAVNACVHKKIIQLIADTPTADPVRHGYWKSKRIPKDSQVRLYSPMWMLP